MTLRLRALFASWEFGVIVVMALLYLAGIWINPKFWGHTSALHAVLRDAAQFGVIAVGMTFVLINKDLDLSVGSTMGLSAAVFSILYAPGLHDTSAWFALAVCLALGLAIGLVNGLLVTWLQVPTFIATLSTLFIGRGLVLGMTGGKNIGFAVKAPESSFFVIGEMNRFGFSNQIVVFLIVALIGGVVLAWTRFGYETYATGGNLTAANLRGINTDLVRIRAFVISAMCAVIAGLLAVAPAKGTDSQAGFGAELIAIAAAIVGGTSILGGRGRIIGSVLGTILIVLIDKLLREGIPTTRTIVIGGKEMAVQAMAQLPPGAVPAFLGLIVLAAVLIDPWVLRRRLIGRIVNRLRGLPPPPEIVETTASESVQTAGTLHEARAATAGPLGRLLAQREVAAVLFAVLLWLVGFYLRPDFWGSLDNSFNLLLAFTEVGLMAVGMAYVDRERRHRPLGRLGAGARGRHRRLPHGQAGHAAPAGSGPRLSRRGGGGRDQRLSLDQGTPAGFRGHARHVLHRPWPRRLAGVRPPAAGLSGVVQSDRAQTDRGAGLFRGRAGARHLLVSARRRGQHPDLDPRRGRAGLRPDPVAHAVRLHGESDRRQSARRGLCRGRHRSSTLPQSCVERRLRGARRRDLHRLLPLVPAARRAAARARRDRVGDHRRRQHLRRLRLGARRARGRGGHHAAARR